MKSLLLVIIALVGTACVNPSGNVVVKKASQFERKTIFGKKKKFTVKPGTYKAKLVMTSSKKAKLKITGVKHNIKLKIPSRIEQNGTTHLSAHQIGQPFDVKIVVDTDWSEGPEQRETEDCTVTKTKKFCERIDGQRVCHKKKIELEGKKRIIFKMDYTDRDVKVKLMNPATQELHMVFKGHDQDSTKRVLHESKCRVTERRHKTKKIPFGDF